MSIKFWWLYQQHLSNEFGMWTLFPDISQLKSASVFPQQLHTYHLPCTTFFGVNDTRVVLNGPQPTLRSVTSSDCYNLYVVSISNSLLRENPELDRSLIGTTLDRGECTPLRVACGWYNYIYYLIGMKDVLSNAPLMSIHIPRTYGLFWRVLL